MRKQQWRLGHAPCPLPSPLPHPPPPPRPPATTPQPMGEQQAPHLTRAMADERWRTSDGGRAMADGVMADEQKFVSPAAGIRTRTPTNARLRVVRGGAIWLYVRRGAPGDQRVFFHISCSFLALRLRCCYLVETAYNMLYAYCNTIFLSVRVRLRCCYLVETAYNILVATSEDAKNERLDHSVGIPLRAMTALSRVGEHNLITAHGDRADTAVHSNDYNCTCVYQAICTPYSVNY
ncbi:hypothetical protein J6590_101149 [Homalodisca vitripennis]|nr:hypothetical protein J6590_101149 [Homalodisca vitripennis]